MDAVGVSNGGLQRRPAVPTRTLHLVIFYERQYISTVDPTTGLRYVGRFNISVVRLVFSLEVTESRGRVQCGDIQKMLVTTHNLWDPC